MVIVSSYAQQIKCLLSISTLSLILMSHFATPSIALDDTGPWDRRGNSATTLDQVMRLHAQPDQLASTVRRNLCNGTDLAHCGIQWSNEEERWVSFYPWEDKDFRFGHSRTHMRTVRGSAFIVTNYQPDGLPFPANMISGRWPRETKATFRDDTGKTVDTQFLKDGNDHKYLYRSQAFDRTLDWMRDQIVDF